MDIYFCDLCGVRVSDTDLRTGHGLRSRWDVICGNCLEQGHGKEWLGNRAKGKSAVAMAVAGGVVDQARDRVATLDADQEPQPVRPRRVEVEAPTPGAEAHAIEDAEALLAQSEDEIPEEQPVLGAVDDTAKLPVLQDGAPMQLAAAANMFSALGAPRADDVDEDEDESGDDLEDRATRTPAEQLSPAIGSPSHAEAASPFAKALGDSPEKDETALVPVLPGVDDAELALGESPNDEGRKSGTGTSSRRKAERKGTTSARHTKKGKTGRSGRGRAQDNSRTILFGSLISLAVIIAIGLAMIAGRGSGGGGGGGDHAVMESTVRSSIKEAGAKVNALRMSDDLGDLQEAVAIINRTADDIDKFEKARTKMGEAGERVDAFIEGLGWPEVYAQKRYLLDKISKLKQQH